MAILNSACIRPSHTAAILSRETKKALFYNAKPHPHGFHCEAWRGKTKLFWSPGTIWPPCEKGKLPKKSWRSKNRKIRAKVDSRIVHMEAPTHGLLIKRILLF